MKNILFTASFFLFTSIVSAQLTTNLILNPRPPATISKWAITQGTITLIVNNQTSTQGGRKRAKIKATLKASDGTEVSNTNLNVAQIVQLPDGQTLLNAAIVYPLEVQQFTGKYQNSLNRTSKLPAGNYQLCISLVDEITYAALTPEKCAGFYVAAVQLPIGMMPANEQMLDAMKAQTAITFRWTPLVPRPQTAVNYRIQVFEVLDNQQPVQALRSNQPILDKIIMGQTQFIWQPQGILGFVNEENDDSSAQRKGWDGSIKGKNVAQKGIQENGLKKNGLETAKVEGDEMIVIGDNSTQKKVWDGSIKGGVADRKGWDGSIKGGKKFLWSIQALDAFQVPIGTDGNYEGRSEPIIFSIRQP